MRSALRPRWWVAADRFVPARRVRRTSRATPHSLRGFTLIELLVGVVLGLLAVGLISSVLLTWEGRKRTTTAGSDAQVNAALALYTLQRDIQMSGFGMTTTGAAGCAVRMRRGSTDGPSLTLAPVHLSRTQTDGPVTVTVMMSGQRNFTMPVRVAEDHRRDATAFVVNAQTHLGNTVGDLMLAVPSTDSSTQVANPWCTVFQVSSRADDRLGHEASAGTPWNQDLANSIFPGAVNTDVSYGAGSALINLGDPERFVVRRYSLADQQLQSETLDPATAAWATPEAIFPHVIDLQGVYGLDRNADGTVDTWTATSPTTQATWAQVLAVRLAVVTRSEQYEGRPGQTATEVTSTAPTWTPDGVNATALPVSARVTCPASESDCWKHYRYKVFETVIPLRNMLWQS